MPTKATAPTTTHPVAVTLRTILDEACQKFLERRAVIEAVIVTILAKENAFILGPPGTAKSELVRDVLSRITGSSYFEALLSRTRPDAAIMGPYNLPELREKGNYHRKDNGFLTSVDYAFLDEIGKMSPTLGHELLAALNERIKHEVNGTRSAHPIPLRSTITASNELIVDESDDAAALWDRLLVRVQCDYIQDSGNFALLLQGAVDDPLATANTRTEVDFQALADVCDNIVPRIPVPVGTLELVIQLRDALRALGIVTSDRRFRKCVRLLQASAFLNGRSQVEDDDLHMLRYALWDGPEQIAPVERAVLSLSNPVAEKCLTILDDAEKFRAQIREAKGKSDSERAALAANLNGKIKVLTSEILQLKQDCLAANRSTTKVDETADLVAGVRRSIFVELMDTDPSTI